MEKEPLIKLTWRGHETIESIPPLLGDARQIEIILPSNYNLTSLQLSWKKLMLRVGRSFSLSSRPSKDWKSLLRSQER